MQIGQKLKGIKGTYILKSHISEQDTYKEYVIESFLQKLFILREYDFQPQDDVKSKLDNCIRNKSIFCNVCAIHDYFTLENKFYIVQDYYEHLQQVSVSEQKQKLITDLLEAVTQLHENNIIHRDIKPCKIGLADQKFKLINFGKYHDIVNPRRAIKISQQNFDAPETLIIEKYQKASDIWALANVIYWVYSDNQMLFQGQTDLDIQQSRAKYCQEQISVFKKIDQLKINKYIQDTLKAMLHPDPAKRPEIQSVCKILQHQTHQSLSTNPEKPEQPVRSIFTTNTEWPSFGFTQNQVDPPPLQIRNTAQFSINTENIPKLEESFIVQQQLK